MELILTRKRCNSCSKTVKYDQQYCTSCKRRKYNSGLEKAYNEFKYGAHKRGISFEVSLDYVEGVWDAQGGVCYLTGNPIDLNYMNRTASLDRIDSNKGYVKGNIRWCTKKVNQMKYTYDKAELLQMALDIVKYHEQANLS